MLWVIRIRGYVFVFSLSLSIFALILEWSGKYQAHDRSLYRTLRQYPLGGGCRITTRNRSRPIIVSAPPLSNLSRP